MLFRSSCGMGASQWTHTEGIPCPPQGRGPDEQFDYKSGIEKFFGSFEVSHDIREAGVGKGEYQESHCSSPGLARVGRGEGVAPGTCEGVSKEGSRYASAETVERGRLLPMLRVIHDEARDPLLFCPMQNEWMEPRFYGVRVEAIETSGVVPVYDIGVEDAHCAMIGPGIFASNCDGLLYGIRRNIKSKEEIAKARGVSERNLRVLRRFGSYGAR